MSEPQKGVRMSTTSDSVGGSTAGDHGFRGDPEVRAEIEQRLAEIAAPDYVDPARKNFTAGDWLLFAGFLAVCAAGFTVWGY
jgi:hypothetical protein